MDKNLKSNNKYTPAFIEQANIENIGASLGTQVIQEKVRLLVCPKCAKISVVQQREKQVRCDCHALISMKERWYE